MRQRHCAAVCLRVCPCSVYIRQRSGAKQQRSQRRVHVAVMGRAWEHRCGNRRIPCEKACCGDAQRAARAAAGQRRTASVRLQAGAAAAHAWAQDLPAARQAGAGCRRAAASLEGNRRRVRLLHTQFCLPGCAALPCRRCCEAAQLLARGWRLRQHRGRPLPPTIHPPVLLRKDGQVEELLAAQPGASRRGAHGGVPLRAVRGVARREGGTRLTCAARFLLTVGQGPPQRHQEAEDEQVPVAARCEYAAQMQAHSLAGRRG